MNFSWAFIADTFQYVVAAVPMTLFLTVFPMVAGVILGFLIALVRINKIPLLSQILGIIVSFFRSVPLLILLFLGFYGIPKLLNFTIYGGLHKVGSVDMNNVSVAVGVLTIYASTFLSEIIRGALHSVDYRQSEASHALGMTRLQTYIRIIIPQAIVIALPNYFNFFLALLKGTSVVFTISVIDIMSAAKLQAEYGYRYVEAYVLVGAFYIVFSIVLSQVFLRIEKLSRQRAGFI